MKNIQVFVLIIAFWCTATSFAQTSYDRGMMANPEALSSISCRHSSALFQAFTDLRSEGADSVMNSQRILWKPFDPATIGVQTLTGAGAVGAIALIFYPSGGLHGGRAGLNQLGAAAAGALGALAFPTAFYFGGEWMGGNGSYSWTLLGCLGAGGIALLPNIIAGSGDIEVAIVRTTIAAIGGAVLGYHLSASTVYEENRSASSPLHQAAGFEKALHALALNINRLNIRITILSFWF